MKGGIRPMVMVKDLTQLTLDDLWKEVKNEEDWWRDINERVLEMVELILEGSLEAELLEELQVSRYKRSSSKRGYRNGHCQRNLYTMYGVIKSSRVPCARGNYESRILSRYQHRQEEINGMVRRMFLAGVSIRRVGEIIADIKGENISAQIDSRIATSLGAT
jgi:putative transposase